MLMTTYDERNRPVLPPEPTEVMQLVMPNSDEVITLVYVSFDKRAAGIAAYDQQPTEPN